REDVQSLQWCPGWPKARIPRDQVGVRFQSLTLDLAAETRSFDFIKRRKRPSVWSQLQVNLGNVRLTIVDGRTGTSTRCADKEEPTGSKATGEEQVSRNASLAPSGQDEHCSLQAANDKAQQPGRLREQ